MPQQGHLLPGLWSGCPHRSQDTGERQEPQGFIGKQWKSPGKGSAFLFVIFFHHVPLLESLGDVEVMALRFHHPKDRKGAALMVFADCSPEL